ncbi:MAG: ROK family glucokinase [Phycisphaerae bacterium]|nr:ROK family glucokinase [Phycisphaerae bacterium]
MTKVCIGIDLGGTFVKFGLVDETRRAGKVFSLPTPPNPQPEDVVAVMADGVEKIIADHSLAREDILGVGVGAPGPLSVKRGILLQLPNMQTMRNYPLRDRVSEAVGFPATLENDANAAAYAEYLCGAGQGTRDMVMFTLGTGVGGGIILDGKVLHGANEMGGEIGHIIVQPGGRPCPCGQKGCLEQYGSAMNLAKYASRRIREEKPVSRLTEILKQNGEIDAKTIHAAGRDGDAFARELWEEMAMYLAVGCVSICRLFDPDRIVFAGGMTRAGEDLLEPIRRHFQREDWTMLETKTTLAIAALGADAGAIGAAGVAWNAFGTKSSSSS